MTNRPGAIKTLCIIAIILGSMGLAGAVFGVAAQLVQPRLPAPAQGPKFAELNAEFERRIQELNRGLRPAYWSLLPFSLAASGLLLAGGLLGLKFRGRTILTAAFGGSLVVDLGAAIVGILTQLETMEVMKWYFREMGASAGAPPGMSGVLGASMLGGVVFGAVWFLAKAVYYVWGLLHLRKPEVRSGFAGSPPDEPAGGSAPP